MDKIFNQGLCTFTLRYQYNYIVLYSNFIPVRCQMTSEKRGHIEANNDVCRPTVYSKILINLSLFLYTWQHLCKLKRTWNPTVHGCCYWQASEIPTCPEQSTVDVLDVDGVGRSQPVACYIVSTFHISVGLREQCYKTFLITYHLIGELLYWWFFWTSPGMRFN